MPPTSGVVLEEARRLSRSRLWTLQRTYFEQGGVRPWTEAVVPQHVTSNPWIAAAYAETVLGWLRDVRALGWASGEPIHIVELGCGSGRFGYLFVARLLDMLACSGLRGTPIRYVLTDVTDSTLDVLRSHPSLQPLVERGVLDFARFDLTRDAEIRLDGGRVISASAPASPLAVIANYVLDGVPQDCFRIEGGRLHEGLVTLITPQEEADPEAPELLDRVSLAWSYRPVERGYDDEPAWNAILDAYRARLRDTTLLFPSAALAGIETLHRLSAGRLLVLSGDKGDVVEGTLSGAGDPALTAHGSVSMMVNYHAIGQWAAGRGGTFLRCSHLGSSLAVVACLFGADAEALAETRLAYDGAIERRGPDDLLAVHAAVLHGQEGMTLERLLACLRFTGWDPELVLGCFPALLARAAAAEGVDREELLSLPHHVWASYFPLREVHDLAFQLGLLLIELGAFDDALGFFARSVSLHGPDPATLVNMALCHGNLGALAEARALVGRALATDPTLEVARALDRELDAAMRAAPGGA